MILLFTIGAASGRRGIRTLIPLGGTALAGRLGKPYPTTFRSSGPTGCRTRISATPGRRRPLGPWALRSQTLPSGPPGSRTPISCLQDRCLSIGPAAQKPPTNREVRPGLEPGPPPYRGGVPPVTLADRCTESRPGRTRTCGILFVRQASWPLDDGTGCGVSQYSQ